MSLRVDAHLHLWELGPGRYRWLSPSAGGLYRDFTAAEARTELDVADIDQAICVQADDSVADTEFLLATAALHPWVAGVVGWVQLDDPLLARSQLDRWLARPGFCGVRHLVHDDPRDGFLSLRPVRESLHYLAERRVPLDVPDAWPRDLASAVELAEQLPELTVVLDHLGKPPLGVAAEMTSWAEVFRRFADLPNSYAKVSGLRIGGAAYDVATLRPAWELAVETFGPGRLMYGGDWPMNVPQGGYRPTWQVLDELIRTLSAAERDLVMGQVAMAVYSRGHWSPVNEVPNHLS